jgi:hypothetical protein
MKLILPAANIGYKINSNNNKFQFPLYYTSTQSKEEYTGYIVDIANENGLIRRFN